MESMLCTFDSPCNYCEVFMTVIITIPMWINKMIQGVSLHVNI